MGQNFLIARGILDKIIAAASPGKNDVVLEIGAGYGTLTLELAKRASKVIAVEKDRRLVAEFQKKLDDLKVNNARIVEGDILKLTFEELQLPKKYLIVANIPYYLTARLIRVFLQSDCRPEKMFLMVQKEVAERIMAKPPRMNLLALAAQAYGQSKILFMVSKNNFWPKPKVDSAFIVITDISRKAFLENEVEEKVFFAIARAAFGNKRKTLMNSLSANVKVSKEGVRKVLKDSKVEPRQRPEVLEVEDWMNIAKNWHEVV